MHLLEEGHIYVHLLLLIEHLSNKNHGHGLFYRGADKSLARPGRKQATATEEFEFHIPYLE
jgi:hypothetical protein